ncbi:Bifunctional polynucleotide phosphatase/kinase AltName: Full=DNA 5'-kinase/3'-phosphatase; AltName: Full=Polynucleotide kinase-3'-phosphatase; Includes: RecName: Full=Polynucleotide 3'-phosphatase; AltName: Full=2'(3')-polynucleotidase; Includes: RecName: Full=Polynucleotide 5'-hydroxyl-kinase [Serendipita indica DSM 11827]|nr:Bifunctional polynucleotide phosphatase/kinase AltName: Full=DNA 5'-kinase/3'-phosphatase; AltName: Full=Polynucleotide kinase-3'-phosphatase; Includes: RecName: Full=Polynucleotide 3'-phosphatase; AltName: Full=2'(3')-polynucleotidase; Includes: RecName: Full=Polynucleotide 5'-hydroxyl-kinase [Serendipita indica DSM 11827]
MESVPRKRRGYTKGSEEVKQGYGSIIWSSRFKPSCLFAQVAGWKVSGGPRRVALFDLDNTLITTKTGGVFFLDCGDWKWFTPVIPKKLHELHDNGYLIFIVTNQLCPPGVESSESFYNDWRRRFDRVATALQGVPFRLLASVRNDWYRKPLPGMWEAIVQLLKEEDMEPDLANSFFVGDFAGRRADKCSSDFKFAQNIAIALHTPDEYFLGRPVETRKPKGFHPSMIVQHEHWFQPSNTPLVPAVKARKPILILFVGLPAIGKSTLYRKYFAQAGYIHINSSRTSENMTAIEEACSKGKSVVVDRINGTKCERQDYVDCAKKLNMSVHCIWFADTDVAWHNNMYRALGRTEALREIEGDSKLIPCKDFKDIQGRFEEPARAEGFKDLKRIYFRFEGTEEERKRYMLWYPLS